MVPSATARAEQRLERASAVPITPAEADDYAGRPFPRTAGLQPFLVRAVKLNPTHGHFLIRFDGRDLYIAHGSLGRHPLPMLRQPLIVALPTEPANVYTTCGMAE